MTYFTGNESIFRDLFPKFGRYLAIRRFLKYITIGTMDECWIWRGGGGLYGHFQLDEYGKHQYDAHVAAYILFIGRIPKRQGKDKLQVCHNCPDGDNPRCVNPTHLWLGTAKENTQDMISKERDAIIGERHANTKLTFRKVSKIRRKYATGKYSMKSLANKFGISTTAVFRIIRNKTWKYKH